MVLQCSDAEESGIGALSGNRFGDKSLGFQCGGGGRTNGGDRLGPRVLVELEAAEVQLSGGIVGELLVIVEYCRSARSCLSLDHSDNEYI